MGFCKFSQYTGDMDKMKKTLLQLIGTLALLTLSAFSQQGLYRAYLPGVGGSQGVLGGESVWLCGVSQTLAQCQTAPIAFTLDQPGASPITAPLAVGSGQPVQFYSVPGNYNLAIQYNGLADAGTQLLPINVPPDVAGNQALNDGYFIVPPGSCAVKASASAGATNSTLVAVGANFTPAIEGNTTAAATQTVSCLGSVPTRLTSGKGITIQNVVLQYGVVTTAFTSTTAPVVGTITFPAPGVGETPSVIAPVAAGGSLTVLPVIGSANLTAQTAGAFFSEKVTFGTPIVVNTDLVSLFFQQGFVQGGAATSLLDVTGLIVHYTINSL